MEEVFKFLKKCGVFYLATEEGNQPRVRPFGAINIYEGKLYIQTGKSKNVSKQMQMRRCWSWPTQIIKYNKKYINKLPINKI